ncbi:MAG: 1,5-anhydro-D-fructose reductase [Dehalococcoidia bacterium]|nr:1,5-anhydro-D-fructose reductase [Bacillota bacterium]
MVVNWGVVGCGGIARRRTIPEGIIPANNSKLIAVMDENNAVAQKMAKNLGVKCYRSEEEILSDSEINAVYIATPTYLHYPQTMKALYAGKHVLVEKPLAISLTECEAMIAGAEKEDLNLGVGYMMRFHSLHRKLRKMVAEGNLGKPLLGRAQLSCFYPPIEGAWRQDPIQGGGGSLIDMGNHLLDVLEYIFESQISEISCFTGRLIHSYPVEDSSLTMVRFQNGALGVVDTFFSIPDNSSRNMLEIYGSIGSILAEGTIGQSPGGKARAFLEGETKTYDAKQSRPAEEGTAVDFTPVNTYQAEIEEFAAAIMENRKPPVKGEEGLWSQKLVLAAYESARTGRSIKF